METCFVIMPIGDQMFSDLVVTEQDLRRKYDDLIKKCIKEARPDMEIVRADEIAMPGAITTDIFTRLMCAFNVCDRRHYVPESQRILRAGLTACGLQ